MAHARPGSNRCTPDGIRYWIPVGKSGEYCPRLEPGTQNKSAPEDALLFSQSIDYIDEAAVTADETSAALHASLVEVHLVCVTTAPPLLLPLTV